MKWIHKVQKYKGFHDQKLVDLLDREGAEGWQLCHVRLESGADSEDDVGFAWYSLIFKKPEIDQEMIEI